jgi:hypothetical protein
MHTQNLAIRIGLDCGQVCAGIIGKLQPRFHAHGAVMASAQKLESQCIPGTVLISQRLSEMVSVPAIPTSTECSSNMCADLAGARDAASPSTSSSSPLESLGECLHRRAVVVNDTNAVHAALKNDSLSCFAVGKSMPSIDSCCSTALPGALQGFDHRSDAALQGTKAACTARVSDDKSKTFEWPAGNASLDPFAEGVTGVFVLLFFCMCARVSVFCLCAWCMSMGVTYPDDGVDTSVVVVDPWPDTCRVEACA